MKDSKIDSLLKEKSGIKLDIGCGANKHAPDWVGMDSQNLPGVDVVHDLLDIPYPFPDESVLTAIASHVLEHIPKTQVIERKGKLTTINPLIMVMDEMWRIMKFDGQFAIAVPHGRSDGFMWDPTHASPLHELTWSYFDPLWGNGWYQFYRPKPWKAQLVDNGQRIPETGTMEVIMTKRRMDVSYGK